MFDIGFSELMLLGVVALIILGPEKLPIAMRTLGRYYVKFKHTLTNIQYSIDQELKISELKTQMQQELDHIKTTEQLMREELDKMNAEMRKIKSQSAALSSSISLPSAQSEQNNGAL